MKNPNSQWFPDKIPQNTGLLEALRLTGLFSLMLILSLFMTGCIEERMEVAIEPSGTCSVKRIYIFERSQVEEEIEMMDDLEDEEEEVDTEKQQPQTAEEKLKKRISSYFKMIQRYEKRRVHLALEEIRISAKTIELHTITRFESITHFIHSAKLVQETGYTHLRMEEQVPGTMALTLYREDDQGLAGIELVYKRLVQMQQTARITWKLPGEVTSSPLPNKKDNLTWIQVGAKDTAEIAKTLIAQDRLTITFKPNGLKLEEPVDTADRKEGAQAVGEPKPLGSDLPLVQAGPGYWAEPVSLRTTQIVSFQQEPIASSPETDDEMSRPVEGAFLLMRLFAPVGRHFLSIEPLKITKALDDHKRKLETRSLELENDPYGGNMLVVNAHFSLPQNDATAIGEIEVEVLAVTCAGWTSHKLRIPKTPDNRAIHIDPVLKSATLMFTEHEIESRERFVTTVLTGSEQIGSLSFALQTPDGERVMHEIMEDKISQSQDQWTRTSRIYYHIYGVSGNEAQVDLYLKHPIDLKKEKINITLTDVDLM